jgi:hypothetical protein
MKLGLETNRLTNNTLILVLQQDSTSLKAIAVINFMLTQGAKDKEIKVKI